MKVLLVEDDQIVLEGIVSILEEEVDVCGTTNIGDAQRALGAELFDLVLTDLHIGHSPEGGRLIVQAARKRLTPVAIISGSSPEEVQRALGAFSPDALLSKPFQLEDLQGLIHRFLALHRTADALSASLPAASADRWEELSSGIQVAAAELSSERGSTWLRMAPGAAFDWTAHPGRAAVRVVRGELEINGERRVDSQSFFLSAGSAPGLRSPGGCLAVSVPL